MASNMYGIMTIPMLKEELREKGARLSGRKHELIERLESYDRNANFGQVLDNYTMLLPDPSSYKDINTDNQFPLITESNVKVFLEIFGQDLREKCKDMYHQKFIRSIRMSTQDQETYVQCRVSAEMVKKCIYKVDVKLDKHCVVQECQCECAAGMGHEAHCKHVAVTLHAITQADKGIITMETCTQVLQTFHQDKRYTGSPVKMADLDLRRTHFLSNLQNFDPRPVASRQRPEYPAHLRSIWLNSAAKDLPIRQLYRPANVFGIVHDHDYLAKSQADIFLDKLHVSPITEERCKEIEEMTRGQSNSKSWKEERPIRPIRLHSSHYGQICKASERANKTNMAKSFNMVQNFSNDATKHGEKYESVAIQQYSAMSGLHVTQSGIWVSPECPYLGCSPDGLVDSNGIVEVKCPYSARNDKLSEENVPYLVQDATGSLTLKQNHNYYYQVMGTLMCTGRKWCDFVVFSFEDFLTIRIHRDDDFIEQMKDKLSTFFSDYSKEAVLETFLYKGTSNFS